MKCAYVHTTQPYRNEYLPVWNHRDRTAQLPAELHGTIAGFSKYRRPGRPGILVAGRARRLDEGRARSGRRRRSVGQTPIIRRDGRDWTPTKRPSPK